MSYSENPSVTPRPTVLPPVSCRTLQHTSVLPYIIHPTSFQIYLHGGNQTVYHIIPDELIYSDPTMGSGIRLNTPQPIMSACEAPPNQPDPFRYGPPHPTRNLGSPSWRIQSHQPQAQPRRAVIQLTEEEDQVVTILLKLHYQEAAETTVPAAHLDLSVPADSSPGCSAPSTVRVDAQYSERVEAVDSVRTQNKTVGLEGLPQNPGASPVWFNPDPAPLEPVNLKKRRLEELTDLEEDAVSVLLSLSEAVVL